MLSEKKVEKKAHGNDFFRLGAFIDHLQFTTATLLAVSDRNGHFGGFQALKGIAFAARPVVNDLGFHRGEQKETMTQIMWLQNDSKALFKKKILTYYLLPVLDHLSQLNDEAVSFVETGPRHRHLFGSDMATALNVQQALDISLVGHHMLEAWGCSTVL